jgi:hypothetical protein
MVREEDWGHMGMMTEEGRYVSHLCCVCMKIVCMDFT